MAARVSAVVSNPKHHADSSNIPNGVDLISSLPDAILHDILSNIPTKFAVRTSLLSKRWKRVWQETPSISIECNINSHSDSIDKTLNTYSAKKITSFDVRINYPIPTMYVNRWLKLAFSRNAEKLSFHCDYDNDLPDIFYVNSTVKQLSLTMYIAKCITISWTSLRNLTLTSCRLFDKSIATILSGCPLLETLTLHHCLDFDHLDLSRSVNLTRVDIIGGYTNLWPEKIVAPHIRYLSLENFITLPTLADVSSLTEANFNLGYIHYRQLEDSTLQDMVLIMLAELQNVEKLTMEANILQILSLAELHGVTYPQLKIKGLTVETRLVRSVLPGIIRLLQNSPGLKKITVCIRECMAMSEEYFDRLLHTLGLDEGQCWSRFFPMGEADYVALLNSIAKDDRSERVALFMKPVLWNAKTLETIVLRLERCLNATEYQTFLIKIPEISSNTSFRIDGQGNAMFSNFKIIP